MVVIGGGIAGTSTALALAEKGVAVAVVEKGRIGAEQSIHDAFVALGRQRPGGERGKGGEVGRSRVGGGALVCQRPGLGHYLARHEPTEWVLVGQVCGKCGRGRKRQRRSRREKEHLHGLTFPSNTRRDACRLTFQWSAIVLAVVRCTLTPGKSNRAGQRDGNEQALRAQV